MFERHATAYDVHPAKPRPHGCAVHNDFEVVRDIQAVLADPFRCPAGVEVSVVVRQGVVTLRGTTRRPADGVAVRRAVGRIPGVKALGCDLTAREPEPIRA
jgi:osmotically-inducible protein OsmY